MTTPTNTNDRDRAVRALLVDTVERTPRRRRWRLGTAAAALVCVLGGAAVGGAVTAAASPDPAVVEAQARAATVLVGSSLSYMRVVGTPVGRVGTDEQTIDVGAAPRGADTFVWVASCRSGTTSIAWADGDGRPGTPARCAADATVSGSVPTAVAEHTTIRITASGDPGWTLSSGWLRTPPMPAPSAAQDEATEDGIVTRSEYLAAFDRFQGCMTARGSSLGRTPTTSLFVAFGSSDAFTTDWCTASEFGSVDTLWQGEHPAPAGADPETWGSQRYDAAADPEYAG